MKTIDAHMHFWPESTYFQKLAESVGHEVSEDHLRGQFAEYEYVGGVVMGNHGMSLEEHVYPPFLKYCIGVSFHEAAQLSLRDMVEAAEVHLRRETCAGIKLYPGYDPIYLSDQKYRPFYELAATYQKPVAIHMGLTANRRSYLKYAHPLILDEVAVDYPETQFVMCHYGSPWLVDAAAVLMKNPNVAADLSGLFEGRLDVGAYRNNTGGYLEYLRTWTSFLNNYEKFLYGTDWPLVHLGEYQSLIATVIPERHWEEVFYGNAARIYGF